MNPYDFVRVIWNAPGPRRAAPPADRWSGITGRLEGTITTETPFFIPDKRGGEPKSMLRNRAGQTIIPGSSLKGLFRSLVETVGGGAWWFFGRDGTWRDTAVTGSFVDYSRALPPAFQRPRDLRDLDAACRMFGFLDGGKLLAGNVGFEDALCATPVQHAPIFTCILSSPKPRHRAWYLDAHGTMVAGRKFYYHSNALSTASNWLPNPGVLPGQRQNQYIRPIGAGSAFTFRATFTNVAPDDFDLLLYALVLEPGMRHKFGSAKPAGLGSVAVRLNWIETLDPVARYRAGGGGFTRYEQDGPNGDTLTPFVAGRIRRWTNDTASITLQDLRRIWGWPAQHTQNYPTQTWFKNHPNTPISGTP